MAKKKIKKKIIDKKILDKKNQIESYINEGMIPYNAALRAGLSPLNSLKFEKIYNDKIAFKKDGKISIRDIAERRGISVGAILDKLSECAGLAGHEGAMRTISAINAKKEATSASSDFIDVPDWYTRIRALHELALMAGYIGDSNRDKDDSNNGLIINIFRPQSEGVSRQGVVNNNAPELKFGRAIEI